MSELTQQEKEMFDISLCKPETYLEILDNLSYYSIEGNKKAVEAFQTLKREMEQTCNMTKLQSLRHSQPQSHSKTNIEKIYISKFRAI